MKRLRSTAAKGLLILIPLGGLIGALLLAHPGSNSFLPAAHNGKPPHRAVHAKLAATRLYLGVRENRIPGPWDPIAAFSHAVGAQPSLLLYYSQWHEPFQFRFAKAAWAHHDSLVVQIQPWSIPLRSIAAGKYDKYLRSYASQVRDFGHPVVIGFGHEMNGRWYPWGCTGQPATAFVAAWRHIVILFRREGASNVTWLWTVSHTTNLRCSIRKYWPGARYVNWVGLDGYYFNRSDTFRSVFVPKLRQIHKFTNDPVLLSETGIGQVAGQTRKLPGLFAGIRRYHLLGLIWFDVNQNAGLYHQEWRLEGHPAAIAAFRSGLRSLQSRRASPR
jgi:hypothetical protein